MKHDKKDAQGEKHKHKNILWEEYELFMVIYHVAVAMIKIMLKMLCSTTPTSIITR